MITNNELKALFSLLDDPDELVFENISRRIITEGTPIIPALEKYWEQTSDTQVQQKIESLIHKVNLSEISDEVRHWNSNPKASLLEGAILLSKYQYPHLNERKIHDTLKGMYRSCWLELNKYLTPLEEVNIINSIFFNMYKMGSDKDSLKTPSTYYINEVLNTRMGNQYSLSLLYQLLCQMLDIPVFSLRISGFVILGYYDTLFDFYDTDKKPILKIQFFIEPTEGNILTQTDVLGFIKKYNLKPDNPQFNPMKNHEFLLHYMDSLSNAYTLQNAYEKADDIDALKVIITP